MTRKIGYGKMGRSVLLDPEKWGIVGGDDEPPLLLKTLAERNPDIEFYVTGRNSGEDPQALGYPKNVINPWSEYGWNDDVPRLLEDTRAARHEFMDGFDAVTRELYESLDGLVAWTGQHGTSNLPIPKIKDRTQTTRPQMSFVNYAGTLIHGINVWRDVHDGQKEEVWLCPDPRNYLKSRDNKWPLKHPLLGQYEFTKNTKFERYGDPRDPQELGFKGKWDKQGGVWVCPTSYVYSRLEICGVTPEHIDSRFSDDYDRRHFGLFINEARKGVKWDRLTALRRYALPLDPAFIHGSWSDASLAEIGRDIHPAPWEDYYPLIRSVRTTLTTPSSGSGWATTKPWQAFAVGTACFFHPEYDTQGHIVPTAEQVNAKPRSEWTELDYLGRYLRVGSPEELQSRVKHLNSEGGRKDWEWIIRSQRKLYDEACSNLKVYQMIEERIRA